MEQADRTLTYEELLAENNLLKGEISVLKEELAQLKRVIYGQKRERFVLVGQDDSQLGFWTNGDRQVEPSVEVERISYDRRKPQRKQTPHGRHPFPKHLRRQDIIIEPDEDVTGLKKIGEEITQELEYKPGELYVKRYIRPKYAKTDGDGIIIGTLPNRPIDKGIPGPNLLAQVSIGKFVDHLPLYRQRQQFNRLGYKPPASTMNGWVEGTDLLLRPLDQLLRAIILKANYLQLDETPIRVLDKNLKGKCHNGFYWVYHDPLRKLAFFDYRPDRSRAGPTELLQNFSGFLQSDGYSAYDAFDKRDSIMLVGCFAHARRKFVEAQLSDPTKAEWMLSHIQELYQIERQARQNVFTYDERFKLREEYAHPILKEIKSWLDQAAIEVLPKSAIGKAILYMLNQWPKLQMYLTDGRLEIDNNLVENAIRPVALGRKNYLFAGSHEGAKRAALIYSLLATAKLHDAEPFAYLADVIDRLPDHPHKRLAGLLPQNWQSAQQNQFLQTTPQV
jgi:transposase